MLPSLVRRSADDSVNLNSVLQFVGTASETQLRAVKIAISGKRYNTALRKDPVIKATLSLKLSYMRHGIASFFRSVVNPRFYLRSFTIITLSKGVEEWTVDICNKAGYRVDQISFKRKSLYLFSMLNCNQETGLCYFTDDNCID